MPVLHQANVHQIEAMAEPTSLSPPQSPHSSCGRAQPKQRLGITFEGKVGHLLSVQSIIGQAYFIALWPTGDTLYERQLIRAFGSMLFNTACDFKDVLAALFCGCMQIGKWKTVTESSITFVETALLTRACGSVFLKAL